MRQTSRETYNPLKRHIETQAELILSSLDLEDEEINQIVEEWCAHDFEVGQVTRCLTKLQRIAFEHMLKRDNLFSGYKRQFGTRPKPDGIALPVEE